MKNNEKQKESNKRLPLSECMKDELRALREKIMSEYDESKSIGVRVNLLPKSHNSMSEYNRNEDGSLKIDEDGNPELTLSNRHADPLNIVIHETSGGTLTTMENGIETEVTDESKIPTKSKAYMYDYSRYDPLARIGTGPQRPIYGSTIAYHARIDCPGLLGKNEIVLLAPAVASPSQIFNADLTPYVYGIERCVGAEQDYHIAIANQAMLTAFVLKEMGYDNKTAMSHIFLHNFYAKNRKACPARMLYASLLVEKSKTQELTQEEMEAIKEYVPWEVFMGLVKSFLERDKYPRALEEKFIYDMSDYDAYMENPEEYNYSERKKLKPQRVQDSIELTPKKQKYTNPADIKLLSKPDTSNLKADISKVELDINEKNKARFLDNGDR